MGERACVHGGDPPSGTRPRQGLIAGPAPVWTLLVALVFAGCAPAAVRRGRRAMARGDFEGAASAYREAANEAPDDADLWLRLAKAELMAERPARAREAFERVAAIRPRDPRPVVEVGFTHELERSYDRALQSYRRAVERAPGSAYPHRVLGTRLLRWGQAEAAVAPLERAVELEPGHLETWKALAMARHHAGDGEGARETFRGAVARHPESIELLLGLAATQVNGERFAEALATYEKVCELRPDFAAAHVGRALLLHELGRPDDAEAAFERAVAVAAEPEPYRARLQAYRNLRRAEPEAETEPRPEAEREPEAEPESEPEPLTGSGPAG